MKYKLIKDDKVKVTKSEQLVAILEKAGWTQDTNTGKAKKESKADGKE